jgi:CHAT domain-containing protein/tetratricopeptide (TPR) repeat protein
MTVSLDSIARQVLRKKLTLPEALAQVAAEQFRARFEDAAIEKRDEDIRDLAGRNLARAGVLAALNCQIARYQANDEVWGNCNMTLGRLYLRQDELASALYHYEEALRVFEPVSGAEEAVGQIRLEVGEIEERQRNFAAAEEAYVSGLALARQLGRADFESDAYNGLSRVHLAQERADKALDFAKCALKCSKAGKDPRGEAAAWGTLAQINHFLGRLAGAVAHYEQGLTLFERDSTLFRQDLTPGEKIDFHAGKRRLLSGLGNVLMQLGRLEEAEARLLEAMGIARRHHDRRSEQQLSSSRGNLYQAKAERESNQGLSRQWLEEAQKYHWKALDIARERGDLGGQGKQQASLGNIYTKLEQFDQARQRYTKALAMAKKVEDVDTQWRAHYGWGNLCAAQGQYKGAFGYYESAIGIVEIQRHGLENIESRTKFWQERATLYKRMVLCCLNMRTLEKLWLALAYTERSKARYLADLLAKRTPGREEDQESPQPAPESIEDTLKTIETAIDKLPESTAAVVFNVTEAGTVIFIVSNEPGENRANTPDDGWQLSSDGRLRVKRFERFRQDTLQNLLVKVGDADEAISGYLGDYYNYVECKNDVDCRNDDGRRKELGEKWRSTLETVSAVTYEALLGSVQQQLARLPVKQIIFMPNLGLSLLPLHACRTKQGYLLDHYEITYIPSFAVLRHCQEQMYSGLRDGLDLFAVRNPEKANPERNLIWADTEVNRIASLFSEGQVRILDGSDQDRATPRAVMDEAPYYSYAHFACHGVFDLIEPLKSFLSLAPDPNRPAPEKPEGEPLTLGLVLMDNSSESDGALGKDLGPLRLPRTRLVVMSACETGLVDPGDLADEYLTLPAGFLLAGAPGVVSTLWTVDDLSTALLMQRFYLYHLKGDPNSQQRRPLCPAQALRRAQQWLRDKVTAKMAAKFYRQRVDALRAQEDKAFMSAQEAFFYYDQQPPDSRPFAHPVYWAPFTMSGQ